VDYNFITPRLATGAALTGPDDVQVLIDAGITHVIDCIAGSPDAPLFAAHPEIHLLYNGTEDDGQPKPPSWFGKSIVFALHALAARHHRVYAHCAAGVNRGPSTAYAIMRAAGWSPNDAEALIRAARPQVGLAYKNDADAAVTSLGYE
jgi:predicted protein tyrosine phosphatase